MLGGALGSGFLLQTWAMTYTDATMSAFLTGMLVVIAPAAGWLLFRDRPLPMTLPAVGVAAAGLAALSLRGAGFGPGEFLTLAAACCWAVHLVLLARWAEPEFAIELAGVQTATVCALALIAVAVGGAVNGTSPMPELPADGATWLSVLFLSLIATAGAMVLLSWGQARMSATRAAVILTLEPAIAALTAAALGGEFGLRIVIGGLLLLGAMFLVELGRPARSASQAAGQPVGSGMLTSIPPSTGVNCTSASERTLGASNDAWVVSTPTTGQPGGSGAFDPRRRVLDHQTPFRREPEQLRAHQIGRRVGFADRHVVGRHHEVRTTESGRRDPGAGQLHPSAGDDRHPVPGQGRQHLVSPRLRDNIDRVGGFRLDHENAQLVDPLGTHFRLQHGHHLRHRDPVDVRLDLRQRPADLVGQLTPTPLDTGGRIHQGPVQVEQDRVHQPRRHESTLTYGSARGHRTLAPDQSSGSRPAAGAMAPSRQPVRDHPPVGHALANTMASLATSRPGRARSEAPISAARTP